MAILSPDLTSYPTLFQGFSWRFVPVFSPIGFEIWWVAHPGKNNKPVFQFGSLSFCAVPSESEQKVKFFQNSCGCFCLLSHSPKHWWLSTMHQASHQCTGFYRLRPGLFIIYHIILKYMTVYKNSCNSSRANVIYFVQCLKWKSESLPSNPI